MIAVLRFSSSRFSTSPVGKPQAGEVLVWLAARLEVLGLIHDGAAANARQSVALAVKVFAQAYMLRSEVGDPQACEFKLQVRKPGAALDRLLGRGSFDDSDAFVRILLEILEREADFSDVVLEWA